MQHEIVSFGKSGFNINRGILLFACVISNSDSSHNAPSCELNTDIY